MVADLSVSIVVDPTGPALEMRDAMLAAYDEMTEHPQQGDRYGVTVFGDDARRWIRSAASAARACAAGCRRSAHKTTRRSLRDRRGARAGPVARRAGPGDRPRRRRLPHRPVHRGARGGGRPAAQQRPLKAVIVLWDGEQTTESPFRHLLDRAWRNHEIRLHDRGGRRRRGGLACRGGGDVTSPAGAPTSPCGGSCSSCGCRRSRSRRGRVPWLGARTQ
ncbi:MAG: hypothetical protein R3F59_28180 [Myxococcota bacterium]